MSTSNAGQAATDVFNWAMETVARQRNAKNKLIFFILLIFKGRYLHFQGRFAYISKINARNYAIQNNMRNQFIFLKLEYC